MAKSPEDVNLRGTLPLPSVQTVRGEQPPELALTAAIAESRQTVKNILAGRDRRLLLIAGPCSVHHAASARRYALQLKALADQVSETFFVLMRVYFEKPRTTVGWKGLIYDPDLNGEYNIAHGVTIARKLMMEIAEIGLPIATELLDPITAAYLSDLVSWAGIGARTTESPTHRQFASGLPMAVGFKNGTDGNIQIAVDAITAAAAAHHYLGMLDNGHCGIFRTLGNPDCHLVLRGSSHGVNYDPVSLAEARRKLAVLPHPPRILIDCSHGNSAKDYRREHIAFEEVIRQCRNGETAIAGVMLESFLTAGSRQLVAGQTPDPEISITDGCISFAETAALVLKAQQDLTAPSPIPPPPPTGTPTAPETSPRTVAYLGPDGTFSGIAARQKFGAHCEYLAAPDVGAVFQAVVSGRAEVGCVPVENSSEGTVSSTLDLLMQYPLFIVGELLLPIRQCLLGSGAPAAIDTIYCHTQSRGQCRNYLASHFPAAAIFETASNAAAAVAAAAQGIHAGALGCEAAAELYNLRILDRNIADTPDNTTRFLIIARHEAAPEAANKTSLCFAIADRAGALCDCLTPFREHGVTLTMIASRPSRKRQWEYLFYVDLAGDRRAADVAAALAQLERQVAFVKVLGSYPAAE